MDNIYNSDSDGDIFDDPELANMAPEFKRIIREEQEELEEISSAQLESVVDM